MAATNVWLSDDTTSFSELQTAFLLTLKYYLQRQTRKRNGRIGQDIEILLGNKFKDMVVWAGIKPQFHFRRPNLGSPRLGRVHRLLRTRSKFKSQKPRFWRQLGDAYCSKCVD